MKKVMLSVLCVLCAAAVFAEKPYWWDNPRRDDADFVWERGSASQCATEQEALQNAVRAAKELIIERIGIVPVLREAGMGVPPEYALVGCETSGSGTERSSRGWDAWVQIKYPQSEKNKMIERWNKSASSFKELKDTGVSIPQDFKVTLTTASGRTSYRSGDYIKFKITAERDCYIVLIDHQTDGTSVLLFPNFFHQKNFIQSSSAVYVPSDGAEFELKVTEPFGDDRIELIACTSQSGVAGFISAFTTGFSSSSPLAVGKRGIIVQAGKAAAGAQGQPSSAGQNNTGRLSGTAKWGRSFLTISTYE